MRQFENVSARCRWVFENCQLNLSNFWPSFLWTNWILELKLFRFWKAF